MTLLLLPEYWFLLPALVLYDTAISFSQEVRCIWNRKFGVGTVLYLCIRYGTILNLFFNVFDGFFNFKTPAVSYVHVRCIASCTEDIFISRGKYCPELRRQWLTRWVLAVKPWLSPCISSTFLAGFHMRVSSFIHRGIAQANKDSFWLRAYMEYYSTPVVAYSSGHSPKCTRPSHDHCESVKVVPELTWLQRIDGNFDDSMSTPPLHNTQLFPRGFSLAVTSSSRRSNTSS